MTVDPAISLIAFLAFALLWLSSGADKLRHMGRFEAALSAYELLPSARLLRPVAYSIVLAEIVVGVLALMQSAGAGPLSAALLLVYAGAVAVNLSRGRREIECGCSFSETGRPTLSEWLVVRNLALAGFSLVVILPVSSRTMGVGDALTVFAGLVSAGVFYQAANHLSATSSPPWATLRGLGADQSGGR